jgi:hypothetical protein
MLYSQRNGEQQWHGAPSLDIVSQLSAGNISASFPAMLRFTFQPDEKQQFKLTDGLPYSRFTWSRMMANKTYMNITSTSNIFHENYIQLNQVLPLIRINPERRSTPIGIPNDIIHRQIKKRIMIQKLTQNLG